MITIHRKRFLVAACLFVALIASSISNAETVLITGANSGLGLEFAKQYADKGWTVIATHRRSKTPEGLAALLAKNKNVRVESLDVINTDSVRALMEKLKGVPIDLLINNAGIYNDRSACKDDDCPGSWDSQFFGKFDYALLDSMMAINVKGPLMVTEALIDNVRASKLKKVIVISSSNGSLTRPLTRPGATFYRASKAALNRAMQVVAAAEQPEGVAIILMHPGAVVTERQEYLKGAEGMIELPFSVKNMIATIDKLTINDTGKFIQYDGATVQW